MFKTQIYRVNASLLPWECQSSSGVIFLGWTTHPIARFVNDGVSCSINSDDPVPWFGGFGWVTLGCVLCWCVCVCVCVCVVKICKLSANIIPQ